MRPSSRAWARPTPSSSGCAALAAIRADPSLWAATPVLLYGFDDLSPLQLEAVEHPRRRRGAGNRVAELRGGPYGVRRPGRAPTRRSPRSPPSTADWPPAPTTTPPTPGRRSATSSGGCSSPTRIGCRRAARYGCWRAPGNAPSWSWWRTRSHGCWRTGLPRRRSRSPSRGGGVSRELIGEVLSEPACPPRSSGRCRSATARSAGR